MLDTPAGKHNGAQVQATMSYLVSLSHLKIEISREFKQESPTWHGTTLAATKVPFQIPLCTTPKLPRPISSSKRILLPPTHACKQDS